MKKIISLIYFQDIGSFLNIINPSCNTVSSCIRQAQGQSSRKVYQSAGQMSCVLTASNEILEWGRDASLNVWINIICQCHSCGLKWLGQVLGGNPLSLLVQHK